MDHIVILSARKWNLNIAEVLNIRFPDYHFIFIHDKNTFTKSYIDSLNPVKIFIPHWSYIIPSEIFTLYECIVFHMTDLPYGRGGSPLQNLIERGHTSTKISALRVEKELDAGSIYLKKEMSLYGSAEEIYIRANDVIMEMIAEILTADLRPFPQIGDKVVFKRRKPEQSNVEEIQELNQLYDMIRMLDAENYPHAFLENEYFRFEFTRASLKADESILADVKIIKK